MNASSAKIQGVWRKPYEVLLIGRKAVLEARASPCPDVELKRRVIVAVPDAHSRKPSLKELVGDAFGFREGRYRALEVFARNLTAGWWAWGDECLRFQWEGWWWCDDDDDCEKGDDAVSLVNAIVHEVGSSKS